SRKRAAAHDPLRRSLAPDRLARLAVHDPGGCADIDSHGEHRALAHDHALRHLRARADEAIALDDDRPGLQRLEHAADARAARDMAGLADLRTRTHRRPRVDPRSA